MARLLREWSRPDRRTQPAGRSDGGDIRVDRTQRTGIADGQSESVTRDGQRRICLFHGEFSPGNLNKVELILALDVREC